MMKHRVDPELLPILELTEAAIGGELDLSDISATRAMLMGFSDMMKAQAPPLEDTILESVSVPGGQGSPDVPVLIARPKDQSGPLPVFIWIHGGGYVLPLTFRDELTIQRLALNTGCVAMAVDYRLAPEHPFPAGLEDCYTVLKWVSNSDASLNIDKTRISIGGASAGSGLAAGLAILARDRGEVDLLFQGLIYPMIDDTNIAPASAELMDTVIWSRGNNLTGWQSYLGSEPGGEGISPYAAPFRAEDLKGLPPAIIQVGELDLFLTENIVYAQRLIEAGIATELHVYPGAYHGFNGYAPDAAVSQQCNADTENALRRAFSAVPDSSS